MGNGRRGDQTYRGNSGYGRRFHQFFQTTSRSTDIGEKGDGEDQLHQSTFAQIDESIETSPCFFADRWEIAESREEERDGDIQLDIILDFGEARSMTSLKQWREIEQKITEEE